MLALWRHEGRNAMRPARPVRGRIAIALEKVLDVRAPLREVFAACGRIERLPDVLPGVREARAVAGDHHHWVMDGADAAIEWDTVVTRFGSNRVIAWETVPGSVLRHAGHLAFRPNPDGSTRITVGLSYVLPPGPFGERVATLVTDEALDGSLRRWRARLERPPSAAPQ
jgi:uncharacterized membrane protein